MEIQSTQKNIVTAPRKLKLVADMVRKMRPVQSLSVLRFSDKAAAEPLSKVIKIALANAKERGLKEEELTFKTLEINEGPKMRRARAAARGRSRPYKKRMSHIKIVLTDAQTQKSKVKSQKENEEGEKHGKKS